MTATIASWQPARTANLKWSGSAPEDEQLSILRQVAAEYQDGQAEYPAKEQVDDLEQHPASQPPP